MRRRDRRLPIAEPASYDRNRLGGEHLAATLSEHILRIQEAQASAYRYST